MNDIAFARQTLSLVWQEHTHAEFVLKDADAALATMVEEPYVLCIPSGTGGAGRAEVRDYYARQFLPRIPPISSSSRCRRCSAASAWSRSSSCASRTRWPWTGCCPVWRPPAARSSSPWRLSSDSATAGSPTSTSTGTRPPFFASSACSIIPSRGPGRPARRGF